MDKKDVKFLLSDVGLIKAESISSDKAKEYNEEDLYKSKDGYTFLLEKSNLDQGDITTALLTKLVKNTNTIKSACIFFVVLSILSIILSIVAVM